MSNKAFKYTVIVDGVDIQHPLIGLYTASKYLIGKVKYMFVIACDMVNVNIKAIKYLVSKLDVYSEVNAIVPIWCSGFVEPLLAIYKVDTIHKVLSKLVLKSTIEIPLRQILLYLSEVMFIEAEKLVDIEGLYVFANVNFL